uniref:Uncharacterized protein n=1 Tax=viral metagenome TaxID=1070528 RepID=A0A6C0CX92_9ZZZZ
MYKINDDTNKYILGLAIIIINIGSRFILDELTPKQKKFINRPAIRRLTIFCIFYMTTRDCVASIILTITFILITMNIYNEEVQSEKKDEHDKILNEIQIVLSKYSK